MIYALAAYAILSTLLAAILARELGSARRAGKVMYDSVKAALVAMTAERNNLKASQIDSGFKLVAFGARDGITVPIFKPVAQINAEQSASIRGYEIVNKDNQVVDRNDFQHSVTLNAGDTLNICFQTAFQATAPK